MWKLSKSTEIRICQSCAKENGLYLKGGDIPTQVYFGQCSACELTQLIFKIHWTFPSNPCSKCCSYDEKYSCQSQCIFARLPEYMCSKWIKRNNWRLTHLK